MSDEHIELLRRHFALAHAGFTFYLKDLDGKCQSIVPEVVTVEDEPCVYYADGTGQYAGLWGVEPGDLFVSTTPRRLFRETS
jgi:hypothetical protein